MEGSNRLELHYYFDDDSHQIDALFRNKCESELLALLIEAAKILNIDAQFITEAHQEGGFRDFWKFVGDNSAQINVLLVLIPIIITTVQLFDRSDKDLEKELTRLNIEEKKLSIEKLKQELQDGEHSKETLKDAANSVSSNLKIIKRKSNFYAHLEKHQKVKRIGVIPLDSNWHPTADEISVNRIDFRKFILASNKLKSNKDDNAVIEIVSPVLKEGSYKWKGIYNELPISFDMQDSEFKDAVLLEKIPFQNGSFIKCVLITHREIDEIGDIKITGYSVPVVIEKTDGDVSYRTIQGKKYRHTQKLKESQTDLYEE